MEYAINKAQNGYLTPDEFNLLINQAQTSFLNYLLGEFQQYQAGHSGPRLAYSQTEVTRQRLSPFIKETTLAPDSTGFAQYPTYFIQHDAMWSLYGIYNIRFVQQDRVNAAYRSVIDPIQQNPRFLVKQTGFQFYPENIGSARLSYIEKPASLVWGYTNSIYDIPTYNPATSVNPSWKDVDMLEIIVRALRIVGVNLQSDVVSGYALEIKNGGQ
jgi:hypothetical protein